MRSQAGIHVGGCSLEEAWLAGEDEAERGEEEAQFALLHVPHLHKRAPHPRLPVAVPEYDALPVTMIRLERESAALSRRHVEQTPHQIPPEELRSDLEIAVGEAGVN
eukprot:CAMPEP_0202842724 /NCGR_PEP_ID=MMETSP1389-20130828/62256_1 /ASSEMBLY_ACC=CAM_ASM_000865 /TAXON_ID=302021 /ORGANISM="Rhodomonas sp., Strain CCMP768" /LENGTH=106 /DNA_ID=CAMNT_0049519763 /DNA_START=121 /DNA_END=438 /DNA_ORIENTATION=-